MNIYIIPKIRKIYESAYLSMSANIHYIFYHYINKAHSREKDK